MEYAQYWHVIDRRHGWLDVTRVSLKIIGAQKSKRGTIVLYQDMFGHQYSSRDVYAWDDLPAECKVRAYRDAYQANRIDTLCRVQAFPELEPQYADFIARLKAERDEGIARIEIGQSVEPPRAVWE